MSKPPTYPPSKPLIPSAPSSSAQPKTMSSRLLTMKFMQRAAAAGTPSNSAPSTPSDSPIQPAMKKLKTNHTPLSSGPSTPTAFASAQMTTGAPTAETGHDRGGAVSGREVAGERWGGPSGGMETRWEFSYRVEDHRAKGQEDGDVNGRGFRVELLSSRPEEGEVDVEGVVQLPGRRVFGSGRGKRKMGVENTTSTSPTESTANEPSDSDSEEDGLADGENKGSTEGDENDWGAGVMIKEQRKAQRRADRNAAAVDVLEQRKLGQLEQSKGEVNLRSLSKISGKGAPKTCHACGEAGHVKMQCPRVPP